MCVLSALGALWVLGGHLSSLGTDRPRALHRANSWPSLGRGPARGPLGAVLAIAAWPGCGPGLRVQVRLGQEGGPYPAACPPPTLTPTSVFWQLPKGFALSPEGSGRCPWAEPSPGLLLPPARAAGPPHTLAPSHAHMPMWGGQRQSPGWGGPSVRLCKQ